jgi:hypothetical protein
LVFAAFLEMFTIGKFQSKLRPGINALVVGGALSSMMAAAFGWLLAENEGISGTVLDQHQQIGIITSIICLFLLLFLFQTGIKNQLDKIKLYRGILFTTTVGVIITGHLGASLTHGEDFLSEALPWNYDDSKSLPLDIDLAAYASFDGGLTSEAELRLIGEVRTILAHNCYKCHSGAKIEGDLRLDSKEFVFKGGESGQVILPGNPQKSELIRRINLPQHHKDVMPSKGDPLSKEEISLLTLWIEKGAPWPEGADQPKIYRVAELAPRLPELPQPSNGLDNPIDLLVNEYFLDNQLQWPKPIDDKIFLRRIFLDIIGLLPSPEELETFLQIQGQIKEPLWFKAFWREMTIMPCTG